MSCFLTESVAYIKCQYGFWLFAVVYLEYDRKHDRYC